MGVGHGPIPESIQMHRVGTNAAKDVKDSHSRTYKALLKKWVKIWINGKTPYAHGHKGTNTVRCHLRGASRTDKFIEADSKRNQGDAQGEGAGVWGLFWGCKVSLGDDDKVLQLNNGRTTLCRYLMLLNCTLKSSLRNFPGGPLVKNPLAEAGATVSIPCPGAFTTSNRPCPGHRESLPTATRTQCRQK